MEQSFDAVADLEEGAVLLDLRDLPLDDGAGWESLFDVVPGILAQLAEAERDARCLRVELAVDLEDLHADALADLLLEVRAVGAGDLGLRHEAAHAQHVDDQAALVLLADLGVHHLAGGLLILRLDPDGLGAGAAQRQDDVAVLVFRLQHEDLDMVAGMQVGRSRLTGPQLAAGDDPLRFRADIDQYFVGIDPDDDTVDDVTVG